MAQHLTIKKRIQLQYMIESNPHLTLTQAAIQLAVSSSTVFRELKKWRIKEDAKARFGSIRGTPLICPITHHFPYVCNGCDRVIRCTKIRFNYDALLAHNLASNLLRTSRMNPYISKADLLVLNNKVSFRILKKQSIYHILQSDTTITQSESTLRRYIHHQYLDARDIDLPRTVQRHTFSNPRVIRKSIPIHILHNRTYQDYLKFIEDNTTPSKKLTPVVVQIDTVIGLRNDKRFVLTLYETSTRFQWAYVVRRTAESINTCIRNLFIKLRLSGYGLFFNVFLTDNGNEFSLLADLEFDPDTGEHNCKVFYCDPYSSFQKGGCERNHELFRYIHKKGTTLDFITQPELNEAFSHINSLKRKSLQGKSPRDAFIMKFKFDPIILGISQVSPEAIQLKK